MNCTISNATAVCALQNYNKELLGRCDHTENNSIMLAFRIMAFTTSIVSLGSALFNYKERRELADIQATPTRSHSLSKVQLCLSITNFCTMGITLAAMLSNTPFIISLDGTTTLPGWLEYDWKNSVSSCTPQT